MPLWFPSHRALAFGDAIVGVDGELRVWEVAATAKRMAWYRTRLVPRLEPLLALETESVLVTHGPPVVGGGREALREALTADPWDYR
jgi:glyoxylase-like metal-dependent hydrolase (beta-lactamase superfamily II)